MTSSRRPRPAPRPQLDTESIWVQDSVPVRLDPDEICDGAIRALLVGTAIGVALTTAVVVVLYAAFMVFTG